MNFAIIPAAGVGKRFGGDQKKQFLTLQGVSILEWSLKAFVETKLFEKIVVCLSTEELKSQEELIRRIRGQNAFISFVEGGASRAESVYKGFQTLPCDESDFVLIHDAVRPLVTKALICRVVESLTKGAGAVIPAIAITDTIKEVSRGYVTKTIDRSRYFSVQTPQGFTCRNLDQMYKDVSFIGSQSTDEAMLAEQHNIPVAVVEGEKTNMKVTTPEDLSLAEYYLSMRV